MFTLFPGLMEACVCPSVSVSFSVSALDKDCLRLCLCEATLVSALPAEPASLLTAGGPLLACLLVASIQSSAGVANPSNT